MKRVENLDYADQLRSLRAKFLVSAQPLMDINGASKSSDGEQKKWYRFLMYNTSRNNTIQRRPFRHNTMPFSHLTPISHFPTLY
jgi:hypothetical protein